MPVSNAMSAPNNTPSAQPTEHIEMDQESLHLLSDPERMNIDSSLDYTTHNPLDDPDKASSRTHSLEFQLDASNYLLHTHSQPIKDSLFQSSVRVYHYLSLAPHIGLLWF